MISNFIEDIKNSKWPITVFLVFFLAVLISKLFFSEEYVLTPFIYSHF